MKTRRPKRNDLDIEWLLSLATAKNGVCLSETYTGIHQKYLWKCDKNHIWEAEANHVQSGTWCPECGGTKKKNLEWLHQLAKNRNGKCLSTNYINNKTKYIWQCNLGHKWLSTAKNINKGRWCSRCAKNLKKDINWLQELAQKHNGTCLSTKYQNAHTKYIWRCNKNHQWEAISDSVYRGTWCPTCSLRHSKSEIEVYEFVKNISPDAVGAQKGLLKNKQLELDIYIPSLKIAIEYDGDYWHSLKNKWYKPERDIQKNKQCKEAGINLIRIKDAEFKKNKKLVLLSLMEILIHEK